MPRLGTIVALLALAACDSTPVDPAPFTLAVVADGAVVESAEVDVRADVSEVAVVEVALAPLRDVPGDPDLERRYRTVEVVVAALNAVSGERYDVGYYLVTDDSPSDVAVVTATADCGGQPECLPLSAGDARLGGAAEGRGAVFFPVLADAGEGVTVRFRPVGLGGAGRLVFQGAESSQTVDAPALGVPPTVTLADDGLRIRVTRGTDAGPVLVVARRGPFVAARTLGASDAAVSFDVPPGSAPADVYLLRTEGVAPQPEAGRAGT